MRQLLRNKHRARICIPIVEGTIEKALGAIREANRTADLVEIRVDYLKRPDIPPLLKNPQKPLIITCRTGKEGGRYNGEEKERAILFKEAIDQETDYIDVEMRSNGALLKNVLEDKKKTKIILSFHDFSGTPSQKELRILFNRMLRMGADVAKIVTFARSWEDNLNILSLIPYAVEKKWKIVTFCMGKKGKISRIFSPLMGAAWTYASLNRNRASAPGQMTAGQMKDMWKKLR